MSSTPTCTQKRMRCGCDKSSMREDIRIVENIKSPCSGCSRKRSLNRSTKSRDTLIRKKDRGNITTPGKVLKRLKIDLRASEKFKEQ